MDQEIATWCSFCSKNEASGDIVIPEEGLTLPVCEECIDNYDEQVFPMVLGLSNSDV